MHKYFFFTNPNLLGTQDPAEEAFGPVNSQSSDFDTFRKASLHSSTGETPAVAVSNGTICVLESSPNSLKVNILFKPAEQPSIDFPFIKYFLYRNILRSSLVDVNSINFGNPPSLTIPFVERISESWDVQNGANPVSTSASVLGFAYDASTLVEVDGIPTAIFANDAQADNLFYYKNPDFQLPYVKAGEYIGAFDPAQFGFEIILERLGHEPTIGDMRSDVPLLSVDSYTGGPPSQTDAAYFLHWHKKEKCLNFIDPCAFYGSFCNASLFYKTGPSRSDKVECNSPQEIHDAILSKFANRGRVYLDIRNDYGNSLNYFKDYGFDIQIQKQDDPSQVNTIQSNLSGWPIYSFELPDVANLGELKRKFLRTSLRLPTGPNNKPMVYLSRAFTKRFRKLKRADKVQNPSKIASSGGIAPFTSEIDLNFPTITTDTGADLLCAGYFKINYYDQDRSQAASTAGLAPSKDHYLNGLFRPLDMVQSLSLRNKSMTYTLWHEEVLVDLTAQAGPSYIANIGIAQDNHHTTFFAFPEYFIHGDLGGDYSNAFTTWAGHASNDDRMFIQRIFDVFKHKTLAKEEIDVANSVDELDVVVVENAPFGGTSRFRMNENVEDYVYLMLEHNKYSSVIASLPNTTNDPLPSYLETRSTTIKKDQQGTRYRHLIIDAYALQATAGTTTKRASVALGIEVFENANS